MKTFCPGNITVGIGAYFHPPSDVGHMKSFYPGNITVGIGAYFHPTSDVGHMKTFYPGTSQLGLVLIFTQPVKLDIWKLSTLHHSWDWCFLAHLSYAQDELLWSLFVRRPSVRLSVNIFKRLLRSPWANFAQIFYGASLGWGNKNC